MADQKAVISEAASKYGIDPKILWGLYGTETSFGKNVSRSSAGAVGPFQFLPSTAQSMGVNPNDFKSAAFGAARYLSQYKGRGVGGMLSAYNAGPAGGYQSGYVNTTLNNAKSFGSAPSSPIPGASRSQGVGQFSPSKEVSEVNKPAFQKAQRAAIVGKLLASEGGRKDNPLFSSGLVTTKTPLESEYQTHRTIPGLPAGVTTQSGGPESRQPTGAEPLGQAPPNLSKPAVPPVKVTLPGYITGRGYPAVEKAKAILEQHEHHPVSVPELRKDYGPIIASAPHGNVHKTPAGPVYVPHGSATGVTGSAGR
jgi:hypothetical protein